MIKVTLKNGDTQTYPEGKSAHYTDENSELVVIDKEGNVIATLAGGEWTSVTASLDTDEQNLP